MNMDEVLQVFIAESQELLQQMEEALLQLENDPDDADTINAIFRAAHTIKGSFVSVVVVGACKGQAVAVAAEGTLRGACHSAGGTSGRSGSRGSTRCSSTIRAQCMRAAEPVLSASQAMAMALVQW